MTMMTAEDLWSASMETIQTLEEIHGNDPIPFSEFFKTFYRKRRTEMIDEIDDILFKRKEGTASNLELALLASFQACEEMCRHDGH